MVRARSRRQVAVDRTRLRQVLQDPAKHHSISPHRRDGISRPYIDGGRAGESAGDLLEQSPGIRFAPVEGGRKAGVVAREILEVRYTGFECPYPLTVDHRKVFRFLLRHLTQVAEDVTNRSQAVFHIVIDLPRQVSGGGAPLGFPKPGGARAQASCRPT